MICCGDAELEKNNNSHFYYFDPNVFIFLSV